MISSHLLFAVTALLATGAALAQSSVPPAVRPLTDTHTGYFPFHGEALASPAAWSARQREIRERVQLAAGLFPLPPKTPLHAVVHGRVVRDDYTIDRVFFESFPGHYVTGNLYLPKNPPPGGLMPGILSPHGHWPDGRFMDRGAGSPLVQEQLATGAERFESGARAFLQARCVQLARMGCAVFIYDMLGYADSVQVPHRSGRREDLSGTAPGTYGLYSPMADLRLESTFGWQTWNTLRALDFLLTVPGVDPARLACTGESGGGTQTLVLGALDDRLAAAFPCVMVSTAMQGGCVCENASYLRINQGNVDLAAAFAPKPMGMTAANDWTKELATKGFPDLKRVWTQLGHPDDVMATFNTHWPHNYNHVSRTTMYGFMSDHFHLGFAKPVLEREFTVSSPAELTVWDAAHPKPAGTAIGGEHEKAVLKFWSDESDRVLQGRDDLVRRAWQIIIGRTPPAAADVSFDEVGVIINRRDHERVPCVVTAPSDGQRDGVVVVWLTDDPADPPAAAPASLIQAGAVVVQPKLYLQGTARQPLVPGETEDPDFHDSTSSACFTFGYNPPLLARRVHDVMTVVSWLRAQPAYASAKIILAGSQGAGVTAAAATAVLDRAIDDSVLATDGFRFASLTAPWQPMFVPGAVKYGDVPALLRLAAARLPASLTTVGRPATTETIILDDAGTPTQADSMAAAVLIEIKRIRN